MAELWIDGKKMDLSPDTQVAVTVAGTDLNNLRERSGSSSNTFELPLTVANRVALGYPDDPGSLDLQPYRKLPAIYSDGETDVINGYAIIEKTGEKISIEIYSGLRDLFGLIEDKSIRDLELTQFDHVWNLSTIVSTRLNNDGFIYPIIDWYYTPEENYVDQLARRINVRSLAPCFFVHTLVRLITEQAGYTVKGNLLSDPSAEYYQHLITTGMEHDEQWANSRSINTNKTSTELYPTSVSYINPNLFTPSFVVKGLYDGFWYTAPDAMFVDCSADIIVLLNNGNYVSVTVDIRNPDKGLNYATQTINLDSTQIANANAGIMVRLDFSLSATFQGMEPGQHLYVFITLVTGVFTPNSTVEYFAVDKGSTFTVTANKLCYYGATMKFNELLPDMGQGKFLKNVFNQFGILPVVDPILKTITLGSLDDVYANKAIAEDWTDKIDHSSKTVSYRIENYARFNYFRYKQDETVNEATGVGALFIDDATLDQQTDYVEQDWSATEFVNRYVGEFVPNIRRVEQGKHTRKVNTRLLVLDRRNVVTPINYYNLNATTPISLAVPFCYFDDSTKPFPIGFNSVIQRNYSSWNRLFYRFKAVTVNIDLKASNLTRSQLIPVYNKADGMYYYVNLIEDYTEGDLTQVQLIRL